MIEAAEAPARLREFVKANRPAIIRGALKHWPGADSWSDDAGGPLAASAGEIDIWADLWGASTREAWAPALRAFLQREPVPEAAAGAADGEADGERGAADAGSRAALPSDAAAAASDWEAELRAELEGA